MKTELFAFNSQLYLNLARDITVKEQGFYKCMADKRKARDNVGPQLKETGDLVRQDMQKTGVLTAFFPSAFTSKTSLQESQVQETGVKTGVRKMYPWLKRIGSVNS